MRAHGGKSQGGPALSGVPPTRLRVGCGRRLEMSNVPKRVSKWSFDEMESFDTLTNAIRLGEVETGIRYPFDMGQLHSQSPALGGGLLGGGVKLSALSKSPEQLRQERLDALWKEVRAHPTYTRLRHASHFAEVSDAFAKRARKKPAGSFG